MSLYSLFHHELTPNNNSSPALVPPREENASSKTSRQAQEPDLAVSVTETLPGGRGADTSLPSPEVMQRVFDVAPLNVTNRQRRLVVTSLIVICNIVQMICNLIGIGGGIQISMKLGVAGIHANWLAASYPYVPMKVAYGLGE